MNMVTEPRNPTRKTAIQVVSPLTTMANAATGSALGYTVSANIIPFLVPGRSVRLIDPLVMDFGYAVLDEL